MKRFCLWFTFCAVLMAGCKKLDQVPQDSATIDAVFGSEKGLDLYTNSFYDVLPSANDTHRGDEMSDYTARSQAPDFLVAGVYSSRTSQG
ncbi:MAG TPA: RagB/SusD family nutrient uptake outer membrane protein, partial [Pedobacter sp.]